VSTVESHAGKLIFGKLAGRNIVAMSGRFHYYEGYDHEKVTFPVYVLKLLGIKYLVVSNACGAINPVFQKTDLMIMTSHINLHFKTPLIGKNHSSNNEKNMYSTELIELAYETALRHNIKIRKGSYAAVQGPNLETRSEYKLMQKIGADVVGMSTVPELLVAGKLGIKSLGLSIVTDLGFPDTLKVAKLSEILEAAGIAEPNLISIIKNIVPKLN
ncbi:MAG: purine-nucleoside phosphorylase, partial [Ignavibacteria bacterium]|nr:purine-nucleoside phosphorylase [Ignavibacteria bacterium]